MPPRRPNLLLITTDQQRWDALGLNGNPVLKTPHLDGLGAHGVNFTSAYSTTPSCIAARRTLLTGQHAVSHDMRGYRDGVEFHPPFTLPQLLGAAGYQTQLVGKLHQFPERKRYGFDHLILSQQLDERPDSPWFKENDYVEWLKEVAGTRTDPSAHGAGANSRVARPFHLPEPLHHTTWVASQAIRFLTRTRDPSVPWFLHLSFWAPHPPLVPPQAYWDRYVAQSLPPPAIGEWVPRFDGPEPGVWSDSDSDPFDPEEIRRTRAGYFGLINHIDDVLNWLLDRVFMRGTARADEPTWILFTSDHGELLGDHQLYRKSLPYEGSTHVPMFLAGRNVDLSPRRVDAPVCLEDVVPTLLDLAGVEAPKGVDGTSLAPLVRGGSLADRTLYGEHSGAHANHWVLRGRTKYVWYSATNEEQLFDLAADPLETRDVSGDTGRLAPMRELLAARLAGRDDARYDRAKLAPLANRPPAGFWRAAPRL